MSKGNNYRTGSLGERLAARYLRGKGFEIIGLNVHLGKYAELDIIAKKDSMIHFIEVKSTAEKNVDTSNLVFPIYNITPRKVRHLSLGAELYVRNNGLEEYDRTIDAIGVIIDVETKKSWVHFFPNILEGI